jgi:dTDP-4-dehydrorhamnose reductase
MRFTPAILIGSPPNSIALRNSADTVPAVKALVLGAGGQLGSELTRLLGAETGVTRAELSVTDLPSLTAAFETRRPEVVFNCAAYNGVDQAESEPELAHQVNSDGAFNAAVACERAGARLVHFSTNFVFDGTLDRPYVESDTANPLSVYARSKLNGERRVLDTQPAALVIRSAALFGDRGSAIKGGSFPDRIVARALGAEQLRVVSDQWVNPTFTGDLAPAAIALAEAGLAGVVHVIASGCCGWDEFARAVLIECRVPVKVESVSTAAFAAPAARPLNGCLGSERVDLLPPWREGVRAWAARRAARERANP